MALLTVPVARALVADLLDAMHPADAVIVLDQLRRRYAPPRAEKQRCAAPPPGPCALSQECPAGTCGLAGAFEPSRTLAR